MEPSEQDKNQDKSQKMVYQMKKLILMPQSFLGLKYDFVPGSEIIFEDNQEGLKNGEFPSKWDLDGKCRKC